MAINVVRFDDAGTPRWGVVVDTRVQTLALDATSTTQLMDGGIELARAAAANPSPDRELADLRLLCPVTADRQLIAQGLNYSSHLREIGIPLGEAALQHPVSQSVLLHGTRRYRCSAPAPCSPAGLRGGDRSGNAARYHRAGHCHP